MAIDTTNLPIFTTNELLHLTGMTRRQLQLLETPRVLTPIRRGRGAAPSTWSVMQVVAAAYFKVFLDSSLDHNWGYACAEWLAQQHPGKLHVAIADKNRALVAMAPTGQGRIIEPYLKPGASREQKLLVAKLDLKPIYQRVMRKAMEMVEQLSEEET